MTLVLGGVSRGGGAGDAVPLAVDDPGREGISQNKHSTDVESTNRVSASVRECTLKVRCEVMLDLGSSVCYD